MEEIIKYKIYIETLDANYESGNFLDCVVIDGSTLGGKATKFNGTNNKNDFYSISTLKNGTLSSQWKLNTTVPKRCSH